MLEVDRAPGVTSSERAMLSIAISVKRIADAVCAGAELIHAMKREHDTAPPAPADRYNGHMGSGKV
jgi:hypothetical protein